MPGRGVRPWPGAGALASTASAARRLLLLAPAPVQRPGQHRRGRAQLRQLRFQRPDPALRRLRGPPQPGVLLRQRVERGLLAPRPAQSLAQLGVRLDLRPRHRLAQPGDLPAQRYLRTARLRVDARFPKQPDQACHLGFEKQRVLRRAAGRVRVFDRRKPLAARLLELPLQRTRRATRDHLRPLQLLRARFGGLRPLKGLLVQPPPVRRRARQSPLGNVGDRGHFRIAIRHAGDHSGTRILLPVPEATRHDSTERLP